METHIEVISRDQIHQGITCEYSVMGKDMDGSMMDFGCGEVATHYYVWTEWFYPFQGENLAAAMCRPHANLALIEERSIDRDAKDRV